ncbi:MAG: helix-turn-helix domain-containing protein [Treponema sp.]|jgi:transcriptional regulator with XRE-family HTH domain|nr:helix-turn-helix domain-containing protein [Treponema sp.]
MMTDIRQVLASNIKLHRKTLGLSQDNLANEIDTATGYIGMIERGKQFPSPQMLERIARALHVDTPDLFAVKPFYLDSIQKLHHDLLAAYEEILTEKLGKLGDD